MLVGMLPRASITQKGSKIIRLLSFEGSGVSRGEHYAASIFPGVYPCKGDTEVPTDANRGQRGQTGANSSQQRLTGANTSQQALYIGPLHLGALYILLLFNGLGNLGIG